MNTEAPITVNSPDTAMERLLMAPWISPSSRAFEVPIAWEESYIICVIQAKQGCHSQNASQAGKYPGENSKEDGRKVLFQYGKLLV